MPKNQLCRNCGHIVEDNYCPTCGQRTNTHRLGWMSFAESVSSTFIGDEAYGLRGIHMRKGAVMTWFDILVRPQRVIPEFIAGRRRKYFNPVTILLLLSTFYAVVFMLTGKPYTPLAAEGQEIYLRLLNTSIDYAILHPASYLLLMLPFHALAMKSLFWRKSDLRYVEYLYIGIFLCIIELTLMVAALPAERLVAGFRNFYFTTLPLFACSAFVFRRLFSLTCFGAMIRALLVVVLKYLYMLLFTVALTALALYGYYRFAPEDFRDTFNIGDVTAPAKTDGKSNHLREFIKELVREAEDDENTVYEAAPTRADSTRVK